MMMGLGFPLLHSTLLCCFYFVLDFRQCAALHLAFGDSLKDICTFDSVEQLSHHYVHDQVVEEYHEGYHH